jgi:hypothetical protein
LFANVQENDNDNGSGSESEKHLSECSYDDSGSCPVGTDTSTGGVRFKGEDDDDDEEEEKEEDVNEKAEYEGEGDGDYFSGNRAAGKAWLAEMTKKTKTTKPCGVDSDKAGDELDFDVTDDEAGAFGEGDEEIEKETEKEMDMVEKGEEELETCGVCDGGVEPKCPNDDDDDLLDLIPSLAELSAMHSTAVDVGVDVADFEIEKGLIDKDMEVHNLFGTSDADSVTFDFPEIEAGQDCASDHVVLCVLTSKPKAASLMNCKCLLYELN